MANFNITYEELKTILSAFENSIYRNVVGYIELLHALKEEGTDLTLKQKIQLENAVINAVQEPAPTSNE